MTRADGGGRSACQAQRDDGTGAPYGGCAVSSLGSVVDVPVSLPPVVLLSLPLLSAVVVTSVASLLLSAVVSLPVSLAELLDAVVFDALVFDALVPDADDVSVSPVVGGLVVVFVVDEVLPWPQLARPSATASMTRLGSGARSRRIVAWQNGQAVASTRSGREQPGQGCMRGIVSAPASCAKSACAKSVPRYSSVHSVMRSNNA